MVLPKGLTQITLNAQTKGGSEYRDQNGNSFLNPTDYRKPLFRYAQLNMGFGLGAGFDVSFTLPNVWANSWYETPANYFTKGNRNGQILDRCNGCTGISDSWLTVQWQPVRDTKLPVVLEWDFKFPEIYRHSDPFVGTRTHDYQFSLWTAVHNQRAWFSPRLGYILRGGALADAVTYDADFGFRPFTSNRSHGFYLRLKFDGDVNTVDNKHVGKSDRYLPAHLIAGHMFTYNDWAGHTITPAVGVLLLQWNVELAYTRYLTCTNCVAFTQWSVTASRPLTKREFVRDGQVLKAPTEQEARTQIPNSITLAPGQAFASSTFDWHHGQDKHDSRGRYMLGAGNRQHDFRFLTETVAIGLPKGFEVYGLVPYGWFKEIVTTGNSSHTGLNDIWVGMRKQFLYKGPVPLGFELSAKFPEPTRHANRYLGEDKHDILISLFTVKSGPSWWFAPKFGYRWREGAFSDELPYSAEAGYRPWFSQKFRDFYGKVLFDGNFSLNNQSPATSGDRFGNLALSAPPDHYFTFNDGVLHRYGFGGGIRTIMNWNFEWIVHKYIWWKNNNGYQRDWTIGFSRWF